METAKLQYSPMEHQTEALKLLQNVRSHQIAISRPSKLRLEKQVTTNQDSSAAARTIAERARESVITQLIDILTQILTFDEEINHSSFQDLRIFLRPKILVLETVWRFGFINEKICRTSAKIHLAPSSPTATGFPLITILASIELRNICVRMALRDSDCQKTWDLRDLQDCLKSMVDSQVSSLINMNHPVAIQTSCKLEEICLSFPKI